MTHLRTRRPAAVALLAALVAVCLAACGSSSTTSTSTSAAASGAASSSASAARTKLVACLKTHGVTLPSRPGGQRRPPNGGQGGQGSPPGGGYFFGGGGAGRPGRGRFAANPKLQAAFKACGGARAFPGRRRFQISHATITKFVTCVRQHGYNLPAPNFSGKGPVFPAKIAKNTKFQKASRSCASLLRPSGAPAPGGGPSGGGGTATTGA